MKEKRESGIELLRIILMVQIVFLHICEYSGYKANALELGETHKLLYLGQWLLCRCPVPLMFMLTGYFTAERELRLRPTVKRCVDVHNIMWFYSAAITLLCVVMGTAGAVVDGFVKPDGYDIWKMLLPFMSRTWYFMTLYILLMLLSPFLNMCLTRLNRKNYFFLVGGLFFLLCIWTNLQAVKEVGKVISLSKVVTNGAGKSLYMAIFMYILGGWVKRSIKPKKGVDFVPLLLFFALWLLNLWLASEAKWYENLYERSDNPIVIIQCIMLLLFFRSLHFSSRIVNGVSRCNIAVYLIHEHPLMRDMLWAQYSSLGVPEYYNMKAYIYVVYIWVVCLLVYAACNGAEQLRLLIMSVFRRKSKA